MVSRIPTLKTLDGGIASFQDGIIKPDPKIFTIFLERYNLKPEECLFIDDMDVNTAVAGQLKQLMESKYHSTIHIDMEMVIRTVSGQKQIESRPLRNTGAVWSGEVMEIIGEMSRNG